jgi:hypothetical protein
MDRLEDESRTPAVEERLRTLWDSYREAVPDPDASPAFMPGLWARIEERRAATLGFRRLAQRFVTVGVAICAVLGLLLVVPSTPSPASTGTYLDALMADQSPERSAYSEFYRAESVPTEARQ